MITNKKFLTLGILVLILVATLIVISKPEEKSSKPVIKIGYTPFSLSSFPLFLAQEKGFFKEQNLEIQLKAMEPNLVVPALLTNEIDYFEFSIAGARSSLKDGPTKMVIPLMKNSFFALAAKPNLELNELKKIGITSRGTPSHYLALKLIEENNLSAEIIVAGSGAGAPSLLLKGQVDALIHSVLTIFQLQEKDYQVLKIFDDNIVRGLTTSDYKIDKNPEEIEKMIKAIQFSLIFIKNDPTETQELLYKYLESDETEINQQIIEEIYFILKQEITETGIPSEEEINLLIKLAKAGNFENIEGIEKQNVTEEDIIKVFDFRFIR